MKITWYGTASVIIETEKTTLIFDPYMKDLPEGKESKEIAEKRLQVFSQQKNILITHGHFDHMSSIAPIYTNLPCKVYTSELPRKTLLSEGFPEKKIHIIKPGDVLRFEDITINIFEGKHIKFKKMDFVKASFKKGSLRSLPRALRIGKKFLKYPGNKECLFYEISAEDKLIQIMGSASLCDDVQYSKHADILILPHQGRSDIDENNKRIVEILKPKRIFLDHFDNSFPPYTTNVPTEKFCHNISKEIPTEVFFEMHPVEI